MLRRSNYKRCKVETLSGWYGHVKQVVNKIYSSTVDCTRKRGRPWVRWIGVVRTLIRDKNISVEDAIGMIKN